MWTRSIAAGFLAVAAWAQAQNPQVELANLREDVRGLSQRVAQMSLRLEELERENNDLRQRASAADNKSYVTPAQLNEVVAELRKTVERSSDGASREATQKAAAMIEKLAAQMNTALDQLAKGQATKAPPTVSFSDNYSKEGVAYVVKQGDSLAVIARNHKAKVQDIINANKITDPSKIIVGQTLFIPGAK
ncbi:MAG TPA: LysM peptidoglycan-binding domain-containing protein [Opitutaceae bacterium]